MTKPHDPELARKVFAMRQAGVGMDVVADQLNLTTTAAKALFDAHVGTYEPGVSRALEAARLERMHAAIWSQAVGGDLAAVDRVVKISERRDKVLAEPRVNEHRLATAYEEALATSTSTEQVDGALIEAGRTIAQRVDEALATGDGLEATKTMYLLPHMVNVLRELLATPAARANAGAAVQPPKEGRLAQLRAVQAQAKGRTA